MHKRTMFLLFLVALAFPFRPGSVVNAETTSGGYWLAAADGGVFSYGNADFHGSLGGRRPNAPVVDIASTPTGGGYWLAAADGGVFTFGDARFFGSMGGQRLNEPIVAMAATPSGHGYWLLGHDGGVFTFGDALFAGSTLATSSPIRYADIEPTPSGRGYWVLGDRGGATGYGDAGVSGWEMENCRILFDTKYVSVASRSRSGYISLRSTGGVDTCNSRYHGDARAMQLRGNPVRIELTEDQGGYWIAASDGGVFTFGNAPFHGSAGDLRLNAPIVGFASRWPRFVAVP